LSKYLKATKTQYFDCLPSPNICKQLLIMTYVGKETRKLYQIKIKNRYAALENVREDEDINRG